MPRKGERRLARDKAIPAFRARLAARQRRAKERQRKRRQQHVVALRQARGWMHQRSDRLRKNGFVPISLWIPATLNQRLLERTGLIGVRRTPAFTALIEVGFRYATTSELIRAEQQWRTIMRLPCAPTRPGIPWEKPKNAHNVNAWWKRQREAQREKQAALGG